MENNLEKQLLYRIRVIDFSIYETVLYLDAYPQNTEAVTAIIQQIEQE